MAYILEAAYRGKKRRPPIKCQQCAAVLDDHWGQTVQNSVCCDICDREKRNLWYCVPCADRIEANAPFKFNADTGEWLCPVHIRTLTPSRAPKASRPASGRRVVRRGPAGRAVTVGTGGVRTVNANGPSNMIEGQGVGKPANILEIMRSMQDAREAVAAQSEATNQAESSSSAAVTSEVVQTAVDEGGTLDQAESSSAGETSEMLKLAGDEEGTPEMPVMNRRSSTGGKTPAYSAMLQKKFREREGAEDAESGDESNDDDDEEASSYAEEESELKVGSKVHMKDGRTATVTDTGLYNAMQQKWVRVRLPNNQYTVALHDSLSLVPPSSSTASGKRKVSDLAASSSSSEPDASAKTDIAETVIDHLVVQLQGGKMTTFDTAGKIRLAQNLVAYLDDSSFWSSMSGTKQELVDAIAHKKPVRRMLNAAFYSQEARVILNKYDMVEGVSSDILISEGDADVAKRFAESAPETIDRLKESPLFEAIKASPHADEVLKLLEDNVGGDFLLKIMLHYLFQYVSE